MSQVHQQHTRRILLIIIDFQLFWLQHHLEIYIKHMPLTSRWMIFLPSETFKKNSSQNPSTETDELKTF